MKIQLKIPPHLSPGTVLRHYKGGLYAVTGACLIEATLETGILVLPAAAFLLIFLTYPMGLGIWLSFTDTKIGRAGVFVGLENYVSLAQDSVFWAGSQTDGGGTRSLNAHLPWSDSVIYWDTGCCDPGLHRISVAVADAPPEPVLIWVMVSPTLAACSSLMPAMM